MGNVMFIKDKKKSDKEIRHFRHSFGDLFGEPIVESVVSARTRTHAHTLTHLSSILYLSCLFLFFFFFFFCLC